MNEPVVTLEARAVCRSFHTPDGEVKAVHEVDVRVETGQCVGLVGRSGSGKTTLLTMFGLLDQPDQGSLTVLGRCARSSNLDELSKWRRGQVGYLFQDAGLINRSRVLDSVTLPLRYLGMPRDERERKAEEALDEVGLRDKKRRRVGDLSGGERQRVGLARALALDPKILICDEPTAPLDEDSSRSIAATLKAFSRREHGRSVIVATHDPVLMEILDVKVELENGRRCA